MSQFVARHANKVTGVLSGFDRVLFRGFFRSLNHPGGVAAFLQHQGVLLKDFGDFVLAMTGMLRDAVAELAARLCRPVRYLESSAVRKEDVARAMLREHPTDQGLVGVVSCVEPCMTWQVFRSRQAKTQELRRRTAKCLHYYVYFLDPEFGWCHVRVQTWMPYTVQVYANGREWLAQQLDRDGMDYTRADNCFLALADVERAQRLMDRMLDLRWMRVLDRLAATACPVLPLIAHHARGRLYWTVHQSELATDVMFRRAEDLAALYPDLADHAIRTLGSHDVMRYLGRRLTPQFRGEVVTTFKHRPEGICVRHRAGRNSIKMYDKAGSVLRVETTIDDPSVFKRRRRAQADPDSEYKPRPVRKTVADLRARAKVSVDANARYLDFLATVDQDKTVGEILAAVLRPTDLGGRRVRALAPWSMPDFDLLCAVAAGSFLVDGFRNRDIRHALFPAAAADRRTAAKVSRLLRLLHAHGLIQRLDGTHRYRLTAKGRLVITAVVTTHDTSVAKLRNCA